MLIDDDANVFTTSVSKLGTVMFATSVSKLGTVMFAWRTSAAYADVDMCTVCVKQGVVMSNDEVKLGS